MQRVRVYMLKSMPVRATVHHSEHHIWQPVQHGKIDRVEVFLRWFSVAA